VAHQSQCPVPGEEEEEQQQQQQQASNGSRSGEETNGTGFEDGEAAGATIPGFDTVQDPDSDLDMSPRIPTGRQRPGLLKHVSSVASIGSTLSPKASLASISSPLSPGTSSNGGDGDGLQLRIWCYMSAGAEELIRSHVAYAVPRILSYLGLPENLAASTQVVEENKVRSNDPKSVERWTDLSLALRRSAESAPSEFAPASTSSTILEPPRNTLSAEPASAISLSALPPISLPPASSTPAAALVATCPFPVLYLLHFHKSDGMMLRRHKYFNKTLLSGATGCVLDAPEGVYVWLRNGCCSSIKTWLSLVAEHRARERTGMMRRGEKAFNDLDESEVAQDPPPDQSQEEPALDDQHTAEPLDASSKAPSSTTPWMSDVDFCPVWHLDQENCPFQRRKLKIWSPEQRFVSHFRGWWWMQASFDAPDGSQADNEVPVLREEDVEYDMDFLWTAPDRSSSVQRTTTSHGRAKEEGGTQPASGPTTAPVFRLGRVLQASSRGAEAAANVAPDWLCTSQLWERTEIRRGYESLERWGSSLRANKVREERMRKLALAKDKYIRLSGAVARGLRQRSSMLVAPGPSPGDHLQHFVGELPRSSSLAKVQPPAGVAGRPSKSPSPPPLSSSSSTASPPTGPRRSPPRRVPSIKLASTGPSGSGERSPHQSPAPGSAAAHGRRRSTNVSLLKDLRKASRASLSMHAADASLSPTRHGALSMPASGGSSPPSSFNLGPSAATAEPPAAVGIPPATPTNLGATVVESAEDLERQSLAMMMEDIRADALGSASVQAFAADVIISAREEEEDSRGRDAASWSRSQSPHPPTPATTAADAWGSAPDATSVELDEALKGPPMGNRRFLSMDGRPLSLDFRRRSIAVGGLQQPILGGAADQSHSIGDLDPPMELHHPPSRASIYNAVKLHGGRLHRQANPVEEASRVGLEGKRRHHRRTSKLPAAHHGGGNKKHKEHQRRLSF